MGQLASTDRSHRGTIFEENALVRSVVEHPGQQYVVRLESPRCAAAATAGTFVHVRCDDSIPMRRPLSIMRALPHEGCIDVLFKTVGSGLDALARKQPGEIVSSLGPIGHGFEPSPERPRVLLIGGGVGIPPMVFLAETLAADAGSWDCTVLMGSELPFPFNLVESQLAVDGLPDECRASLASLEALGIRTRLASLANIAQTFRGYVTELADRLLSDSTDEELARTALFACGPTPMLAAAAGVANRYGVPCQVSLEEFMACAVGGCAGCTVPVHTENGIAMQRVCVDGPVFEARQVFPPSE